MKENFENRQRNGNFGTERNNKPYEKKDGNSSFKRPNFNFKKETIINLVAEKNALVAEIISTEITREISTEKIEEIMEMTTAIVTIETIVAVVMETIIVATLIETIAVAVFVGVNAGGIIKKKAEAGFKKKKKKNF